MGLGVSVLTTPLPERDGVRPRMLRGQPHRQLNQLQPNTKLKENVEWCDFSRRILISYSRILIC